MTFILCCGKGLSNEILSTKDHPSSSQINNSFLHLCIDASSRLNLYMHLFRSFTYYEKTEYMVIEKRKRLSWTTIFLFIQGTLIIGQIDENQRVSLRFLVSFKNTINLPFYLHFLPIYNFGTEVRSPQIISYLCCTNYAGYILLKQRDLTNIFLAYFAVDSGDTNFIYDFMLNQKFSLSPKNMNHKNYIA